MTEPAPTRVVSRGDLISWGYHPAGPLTWTEPNFFALISEEEALRRCALAIYGPLPEEEEQ
jgi:hypothetical protein